MKLLAALCVATLSCQAAPPTAPLRVSSPAFRAGAALPVESTCDGADTPPALKVAGVPASAPALALVVDDPDAPGGTFTHWLAWNAPVTGDFGAGGVVQGLNDFGKMGWSGPCPPAGAAHHYRFHVLALDAPLALAPRADRNAFDAAVKGHVVAEGSLTGTYSRSTK